jgi:hypothetical protein
VQTKPRVLAPQAGFEVAQGADELRVLAPTLHGVSVQGLAHLPVARRHHRAAGQVELQATLIPFKSQEAEDFPGPQLLVAEKWIKDRRASWERKFDRLGDLLGAEELPEVDP